MVKVFIDGKEGTTGLKIFERFSGRDDIELLEIPESLRKDSDCRKEFLSNADIAFLCLPDVAAKEAVELAKGSDVKIIDASTAHRTNADWSYGFPELSDEHRHAVINGSRVAVPGCHASGFQAIVFPLVKSGIAKTDYPFSCNSLTGYSGGGKKMIAEYESDGRPLELDAPRHYGLTQEHKHLKEMQYVSKLDFAPLFNPIVDDFYSGMVVTVPLFTKLLNKAFDADSLRDFYAQYYKNQPMIHVLNKEQTSALGGFISANALSGKDSMEIIVTGGEDRVSVHARFDNLGKGASGAAIQCMNLMTGQNETKSLSL